MINSILYNIRKSVGGTAGMVVCMILMAAVVCVLLIILFMMAKQLFKAVLYVIGSTARVKAVAVILTIVLFYVLYLIVMSDKWEWIKTLLLEGN